MLAGAPPWGWVFFFLAYPIHLQPPVECAGERCKATDMIKFQFIRTALCVNPRPVFSADKHTDKHTDAASVSKWKNKNARARTLPKLAPGGKNKFVTI